MALTDKERVFSMAVADGKTQYEAYCIAYDTKTDKRNTVDVNACKVASKPEVKEYIESLRQRKEEKAIYSDINDINKRFDLIWERIEECRLRGDDNGIARYIEIINKMTHTYQNINVNINEEEKPLKNLSSSELKALLNKE